MYTATSSQSDGEWNDYFHLISGQDFPCKSNKEFDEFFENHKGSSYMLLDSDEYRQKCMERKYPSRIKPWYFYDIRHRNLGIVNFMARSLNFLSRRLWWRRDIQGLWGGWQWFSWYRTVAEYVVNEEKENPSFFRRFHHTSCSDELIFATLLHGKEAELHIVSDESLRYINWNKVAYVRKQIHSPLILNEEEYDEIVNSGAFFCRKVHPVISERLLTLLENKIKDS